MAMVMLVLNANKTLVCHAQCAVTVVRRLLGEDF